MKKCGIFVTIVMAGIAAAVAFGTLPAPAGKPAPLYYFNPDAASPDPGPLVAKLTRLAAQNGFPVKVQPFAQLGPLAALVPRQKRAIVIMPYWSYEQLSGKVAVTPIMIPVKKEKVQKVF